jgi:hypothetical protein
MLRTAYVFDAETVAFLEGGCALIIGTVEPGGKPRSARGWGLTLLDGEARRARLLLDAEDDITIANAAGGGAIAVTAADVLTLRSIQLKGRSVGVEPADDDDEATAEAYYRKLFTDIEQTDGTPWEVAMRMVPVGYVACTLEIEDAFDQTPGPEAGGRIGGTSR